MTTRLDQLQQRAILRDRLEAEQRALNEVEFEEVAPPTFSALAAPIPTATLTAATASWLALTFALCYAIIPTALTVTNLGGSAILGFWPQFPAFILAAIAATAGVAIAKPRIDLHQPSRDPVLAATAGGLAMWFLLQNTVLMPLALIGPWSALALVLANVVEMTLLGTMFASFTKRPLQAMMMGAGFQFGVFVLAIFTLILAL